MDANKVISIFEDVQRTSASHRSSLSKLSKIAESMNEGSSTVTPFILNNIMSHVLVISKKEPKAERVIDFFGSFIAQSGPDSLSASVEYLLLASCASDKTIRLRACETLANLMKKLSDQETEISASVLEAVEKVLVRRLRDKIPGVRVWAIRALSVLQDVKNPEDAIMAEIVRLLSSDASKDVRVAAVQNVGICKSSLSSLLDRIKDVSPEVRIACYERLAQVVDIRHLKVPMRCMVFQYGLGDRDDLVRQSALTLVMKWLGALEFDMAKMLNLCGLQSYEAEAELMAQTILSEAEKGHEAHSDCRRIFRTQCPDWSQGFGAFTPGELLWAQIRCDFYGTDAFQKKTLIDDIVSRLRPDTVRLCELVAEGYHASASRPAEKHASYQLCMKYLLRLAASDLDITDIAGCTELKRLSAQLMSDYLSLPSYLLEPAFSAWSKATVGLTGTPVAQSSSGFKNAAELVNTEAMTLIKSLWTTISAQSEEDIEESRLRAMEIAIFGLQLSLSLCGNIAEHPSSLIPTVLPYSLECLQTPLEALRMAAVRCLGLIGLCSESNLAAIWDILVEVGGQIDESDITRCWAIQSISDLAIARKKGDLNRDTRLQGILLRGMDRTDISTVLARVAAEASAKLLFSGSLRNAAIFGALLKIYFAPGTTADDSEVEDDLGVQVGGYSRTQQMLGVFFKSFYKVGHGRDAVILEAIPSFISEYASLCADKNNASIQDVLSYLLALGDDKQADELSGDSFRSKICSIAFASLASQCLKLGSTEVDKTILKELVRAICDLNPISWAAKDATIVAIGDILEAVLKNSAMDKTSAKALLQVYLDCRRQNVDDSLVASAKSEFVQQVPLLTELLDSALSAIAFRGGAALAFDFDSAVSGAGAPAAESRGRGEAPARRRARPSAQASQSSEEDSDEACDEGSDVSDDEMDRKYDPANNRAPTPTSINTSTTSGRGRRTAGASSGVAPAERRQGGSSRSSKALASSRISQQIGDENAENISLRVSSAVSEF